jgi:hypothetical protein
MVREGAVELHQHQAFAPIFLRKREAATELAIATEQAPPGATTGH